jgi:protein-disulfide isomerase
VNERRQRLLQLAAAAAFLAVAAVAVLIVVEANSGEGGDPANLEGAAPVRALLDGIPQRDMVLGDPRARVELVEYGDLQCPVCKGYAEEILPPVIESQVRSGKARLSFRNFAFIGPQSATAGAAALAAGAQGRGWQYVELFYRNQGRENAGYADDEFLTAVARAAGVEDVARWNADRRSDRLADEVTRTTEEAQRLGLTGTPSFAVERPGGEQPEVIGTPGSAAALEEAIEEAG